MSSDPPPSGGNQDVKIRLCTICKKPRRGHPPSGCPNAIVIPIHRTQDGSSISTTTPTIHLQTSSTSPFAGNPQGYSISVADNDIHLLSSRSPSVKPTAAQLQNAQVQWNNMFHGHGTSTSLPYDSTPQFTPNPERPANNDPQWPSNAEWQLILVGQRDHAGNWIVTSRDAGGSSTTASHPQPSSMPSSFPTPPAMPTTGLDPVMAAHNGQVQHAPTTSTQNMSDSVVKLILAALVGAALALYGVARLARPESQ